MAALARLALAEVCTVPVLLVGQYLAFLALHHTCIMVCTSEMWLNRISDNLCKPSVMNVRAVCRCVAVCGAVPDKDRIDRRAGLIVHEFKSLVFAADYQPGAKRKARHDSTS